MKTQQMVTETGCTVTVAGDLWAMGPGSDTLVLELRMEDGRRAELKLTWNERRELARMLEEA